MYRMPRIVSRRLGAQPTSGPHPDPEVMAAFAENALSDGARGQLLQHLEACSDCREILYLALPDSPEAQEVLVLQPRPFRRWALGWGALVASVAIASIFFTASRLEQRKQRAFVVATAPAATKTETRIAAEKSPPELDQIQAARDASKTAVALQKSEPKPQPQAKRMTGKMSPELVFEESGQVHVQSQEKSADAMGALVSKADRQKQNVGGGEVNGSVAQTGSAGKVRGYAYARSEPSQTKADQQAVSGQQASVQANAVSGSDSEQAYVRNAPAKKETTETAQTLQRTNALDDLPAAQEVGNLTVAPQKTSGSARNRKTSGAALSDLRLAHGSTLKGNLYGTIVDTSGAVIGKAKIMMVGPTGAKTASSDLQGRFSFDLLPPGYYSIKAWASGFKATEIKQVAVLDNKTSTLQLRLDPGSASEVVEVTAAAPSANEGISAPGAPPITNASTGLVAGREQTGAQFSVQKDAAANSQQKAIGGAIGAGSGAAAASYAWTLSPQGAVQRSSDNAKTWQLVSVATGATFRALSAIGSNVWAGGKAGALYHSADSGQTWTKVEPAAGGKKLDDDIVRVDFSDALTGTVNTAKGEIWNTSDGGQTWQRK
jgi:Carboxypeptidase regulatory-like domain/Photosynthesis system II assembly factor YCF48